LHVRILEPAGAERDHIGALLPCLMRLLAPPFRVRIRRTFAKVHGDVGTIRRKVYCA
jgi:hypothetical protein